MSLTPAAEILAVVQALPAPIVRLVLYVVRAIASSDDPTRTALRAAKAAASREATDEALKQILGGGR
jgi:hypothetical protein